MIRRHCTPVLVNWSASLPIKKDTYCGTDKVNPNSTGPSRKQKEEAVVFALETVDGLLPLASSYTTVQALVSEITKLAILRDKIEHLNHLRKDQNLMSFLAKLWQRDKTRWYCKEGKQYRIHEVIDIGELTFGRSLSSKTTATGGYNELESCTLSFVEDWLARRTYSSR